MNSPMTRRATSVSIASSAGSSNAALVTVAAIEAADWRDVEAGLGARSSAVESSARPGPLGDDPLELADLELGPLVAQQRQRDPRAADLAEVDVDQVQALVVERGAEDGGPVGADDLGAAPEADRLLDPDPVDEHHEARRQLGVGPHERPPRGRRPEADLVRRGQVAARRRRDVDQDLGAVEREELGHRAGARSPRRSPIPSPTPSRDGTARRRSPGGEEPALVEQPVGRQEQLAVDVDDLGRPRAAPRR